jgi:hypothetical protein
MRASARHPMWHIHIRNVCQPLPSLQGVALDDTPSVYLACAHRPDCSPLKLCSRDGLVDQMSFIPLTGLPMPGPFPWHERIVFFELRHVISCLKSLSSYLCRVMPSFVLFFVLNQHRSRPNKTYAGQKKSQILSSWTKPPFEAPQSLLSPNPSYAELFLVCQLNVPAE